MENKQRHKGFIIGLFITYLLSIFMFGFTLWTIRTFGKVDFEQYWFGITGPTAGTPLSFYIQIVLAILAVLILTVLLTSITVKIMNQKAKKLSIEDQKHYFKKTKRNIVIGSLVVILISMYFFDNNLKISQYFLMRESSFMQEHYVEPDKGIIKFPEKKKNLIYIYLESFEATYFSEELGGAVEHNLVPNLTNYLNDPQAINFSQSNQYGGGQQAPSTGYSIAGMFSQQSGLPFKVNVTHNYAKGPFVPGAITLGDILNDEGYNLQFAVGADGLFAGVNNLYKTHGNFEVLDLTQAKKENRLPQDYYEWWGFEDKKLFEYGKEYLNALSQKDAPFALILEADDSHFPKGYTDKSCPTHYKEPYENSISCVDSLVSDFIEYVQAQDYYQDTVIIIHGDHLSMEKDYFKTLDKNYMRTTFNAYLNVDTQRVKNAKRNQRNFYSMDVFPTILEAMNVEIEGHRLGIGTSLFSNIPTFYEMYGVDSVNKELQGPSKWFTNNFLIKHNNN